MARVKRAAEVAVPPRDAAEANAYLMRLGAIQRDQAVIQAALEESIATATNNANAEVAPLTAEADGLTRGLQIWAEANRDTLTNGGRTKTVPLPGGEIAWRTRPPAIKLTKAEMVLAVLRAGKTLARFVRVKYEVNKEALLAEPVEAAKIAGVTVVTGIEDFVVTPIDASLPAASAADGRAA